MRTSYRRSSKLSRIQKALNAFYLLQKIDWEYDIRTTLDKILEIALEDIELEGGRHIERALLIIQHAELGTLEVHAGWRVGELDLSFSRTVVQQAMGEKVPILSENAKEDPRFHEAESLKALETLSIICIPVKLGDQVIGALYIESHSPTNIFSEEDLEFLAEFNVVIAPYIKMALTHQGHVLEIQKLRSAVETRQGFDNIVGRSEPMRNALDLVRLAGGVDRTVLLTGESGSGKELVAHAIHRSSPRKNGPMIVVDCSALADHLLESELFGHVRGSFTGATMDKMGAFEEANGGTIFLDEISDAPKPLQQMLRRVLQEGEIRRVGENQFRKVDVRVICATNRDLHRLVEGGEFMRDLYYRINKIPIKIPSLRERREDIPLLVHHFLDRWPGEGEPAPDISAEAVEMLARFDWKENNVRELRNVVELAADLTSGKTIHRETIESVLRIQKGEPMGPFLDDSPAPAGKGTGGSDGDATASRNLVQIQRESFRELLARQREGMRRKGRKKESSPFYVIQKELAVRAIIEGLRTVNWKLRPASRLLGISPMKLRGTLREYLSEVLALKNGDVEAAAAVLDIPLEVLQKKAGDLGLEEER